MEPIKFVTVDTEFGLGAAPSEGVALAVQALGEDGAPAIGVYVAFTLYPGQPVVMKAPLEELAKKFGLAILSSSERKDRFGISPRVVRLLAPERGVLNTTVLHLVQLPNTVPMVKVDGNVEAVIEALEAAGTGSAPPTRLVL